jgi:uncharacterized protein (UPF0212 family)
MKCPFCKKEINQVIIEAKCWLWGYLKNNKVIDYSSVNEIEQTDKIECPECFEDIKEYVRE